MYYLMYMERGKPRSQIFLDRDRCTDCGYCLKVCKEGVFWVEDARIVVINESNCNGCRKCVEACVYKALSIIIQGSKEVT